MKPDKAKLSVTIILALLTIVQLTSGAALEEKSVMVDGENVSFTPLFDAGKCNETITSAFRIEREEYESGVDALTIPYTISLHHDNATVKEEDVTKTINMYSSANTAQLRFNETGTYKVDVTVNETNTTKMTWIHASPCTATVTDENQSENNTADETTNTTEPEQPEENEEENEDTTTEDEKDNTTITTAVQTDKRMYAPGERATLEFVIEPQPEDATVTYWIEDVHGTVVKRKYTTSTLSEKHYTFKEIEQPDKAYVVYANISAHNTTSLEQAYTIVKQTTAPQDQEETEDEEKAQSSLSIEEIEVESETGQTTLFLDTIIRKGDTRAQVVEIEARDDNENLASEKVKLKLTEENSELQATIPLDIRPSDDMTSITVNMEGLGLSETRILPLIRTSTEQEQGEQAGQAKNEREKNDTDSEPKIIKTYTRQELLDDHLNWYVRVDSTGITTITATSEHEELTTTDEFSGEKTTQLTFKKPSENMTITTTAQVHDKTARTTDHITLRNEEDNKTSQDHTVAITGQTTASPATVSSMLEPVNQSENTTVIEQASRETQQRVLTGAVAGTVLAGIIVMATRRRARAWKRRNIKDKNLSAPAKEKNPHHGGINL